MAWLPEGSVEKSRRQSTRPGSRGLQPGPVCHPPTKGTGSRRAGDEPRLGTQRPRRPGLALPPAAAWPGTSRALASSPGEAAGGRTRECGVGSALPPSFSFPLILKALSEAVLKTPSPTPGCGGRPAIVTRPPPSPPQLGARLRGHKDEQLRSGGEVGAHPEVPGSPESVPWRASATGTPQRPGQCRGQGLRTGGDWAAACDARLGSRWPLISENRISGRRMSPGTLHRTRVRRPVLWSEHYDFATR